MREFYVAVKGDQEIAKGTDLRIHNSGVIEIFSLYPVKSYIALAPGQWDSVYNESEE